MDVPTTSTEPHYRRGNKTRLRLSVSRKSRKGFRGKKEESYRADEMQTGSSEVVFPSSPVKSVANVPDESHITNKIGSVDVDYEEKEKQVYQREESSLQIEGRRIVDINYFVKSLMDLADHSKLGCTLKNIQMVKEDRRGFISFITFKCSMCKENFVVETSGEQDDDINKDFVLGMMNIGSGFSHMEQLCSSMDIPCMSKRMYEKTHDTLSNIWEKKSFEAMQDAANEEKALSVAAGDVDENGIPKITVIVDGSWAKRSYRSNYNSLSGMAAIVGHRTGKVLFIGVRNKFCSICKYAESRQSEIPPHKCYKNWDNASASMEGDIIAEGFRKSLEMYGLIYSQVIADGDSNVFKSILDSNPYPNIVVKKIECKNHLLRNYSRKIKELTKEKNAGPLILRKQIQKNELRLRYAISKAINHRKNEDLSMETKVSLLKADIENSLSHIFGEHRHCQTLGYFCQEPYTPSNTIMADLQLTELFDKLSSYNKYLARHASSLIYDVDNNRVEQFNSIICKFIGGKRINYCKRRSYQARCAAAVVSHNTKRPIYTIKKYLAGKSPGKISKTLEIRNKGRKRAYRKSRKRLNFGTEEKKSNAYYGENCEKPDMEAEELEKEKESFLKLLSKTQTEIDEIEKKTRIQREWDLWYIERRKRLTASKFGPVCKRRMSTSCRFLVESIIYPKILSAESVEYGRRNEEVALKDLEKHINNKILPSGLLIDKYLPYLAASPDGLLDDKGLVEIKCPWSARDMTPEEGIQRKKITVWLNGEINQNHIWFYQIQGQLHITERQYCLLGVWTPQGMKTEVIFRDDEFWSLKMEPNLTRFYMDCLLPELIDPRRTRNMPIREPAYIEQAKKSAKKRKA